MLVRLQTYISIYAQMHLKTNGKTRVCKQTAMTPQCHAVVMHQSSKFDTVEIKGFYYYYYYYYAAFNAPYVGHKMTNRRRSLPMFAQFVRTVIRIFVHYFGILLNFVRPIYTARRYASAVYAMALCLSVCASVNG